MNWKDRISVDPKVLVGKPIVRGTRISMELLMDRHLAQQFQERYFHIFDGHAVRRRPLLASRSGGLS